MFPIVAIIAIHNKMASFEERDASSGWFVIEAAAWTLADELNKEYSVLKSSLGESINAPPITGICGSRMYNIRDKIQEELCSLYPVQESLCNNEGGRELGKQGSPQNFWAHNNGRGGGLEK